MNKNYYDDYDDFDMEDLQQEMIAKVRSERAAELAKKTETTLSGEQGIHTIVHGNSLHGAQSASDGKQKDTSSSELFHKIKSTMATYTDEDEDPDRRNWLPERNSPFGRPEDSDLDFNEDRLEERIPPGCAGFWTQEEPQVKPQGPVVTFQGETQYFATDIYKIVHRGRLVDKIEIALKKGLSFVFANARMYKDKDGVKRSTSDYYASTTLERFQRWMTHERRTGEFVQVDEVYSDKTPLSFVVDFEQYLDKTPSADSSLFLVKQVETIVEAYLPVILIKTKPRWLHSINSRWIDEKSQFKISFHLMAPNLIFKNINHLGSFVASCLLPTFPAPIIDMGIYRKQAGQFRLPMCPKASAPNVFPQFVRSHNMSDYVMVKHNVPDSELIVLPEDNIEKFTSSKSKSTKQQFSFQGDTKETDELLDFIKTKFVQKFALSKNGVSFKATPENQNIIQVTYRNKPYKCPCSRGFSTDAEITHQHQDGYMIRIDTETFRYYCHDKITCNDRSVFISRHDCDSPFDWCNYDNDDSKVSPASHPSVFRWIIDVYSQKYCKDIEFPQSEESISHWQLIIAKMGCGKTESICRFIASKLTENPDFSFLVVTSRISLAVTLHGRFRTVAPEIKFYHDIHFSTPSQFVVEYESIHDVDKIYECVILDECVSLLNSIGSPTNGLNQVNNWEKFSAILKHADQVILMDADMESNHAVKKFVHYFHHVKSQTNRPMRVKVSKLVSPPTLATNRRLIFYPHESISVGEMIIKTQTHAKWEATLKMAIENGEKIIIVLSSKNYGEKMFLKLTTELKLEPDSIAYYRSDMDNTQFNKLSDVNEEWGKSTLRVIMYTSKVSVGVDCTVPIDRMFVQCGNGPCARELIQMCGRARNLKHTDIHVVIPEIGRCDELPYHERYKSAVDFYKKRKQFFSEWTVNTKGLFERQETLPLQLYATYSIEPTSKWLWRSALLKGWDVCVIHPKVEIQDKLPVSPLSLENQLWAAFCDEHFPVDTETYNRSTSLIMKHAASEIDYFIRDVYNVQSVFRELKSADEKVNDEIELQFRDLDKFKQLKKTAPVLERLKMLHTICLSDDNIGISALLNLQKEETTENNSKFGFLCEMNVEITQVLIGVAKRMGLTSLLDFETEFSNDDVEVKNSKEIVNIRDNLFHWPNRTKIPMTIKGVFTHVIYDLFGLLAVESSQRRVKGKINTQRPKRKSKTTTDETKAAPPATGETMAVPKKPKGAPVVRFYKLALSKNVDFLLNLTRGILKIADDENKDVEKPEKPAKATRVRTPPAAGVKKSRAAKKAKKENPTSTGSSRQSTIDTPRPSVIEFKNDEVLPSPLSPPPSTATNKRKPEEVDEPIETWKSDGTVKIPRMSNNTTTDSVAQQSLTNLHDAIHSSKSTDLLLHQPPSVQQLSNSMQSSAAPSSQESPAVKMNKKPDPSETAPPPPPPLPPSTVSLLGPDYILRFTLWVKLYRAIEQEFHKPSSEWRISKFIWQALEQRGWTAGLESSVDPTKSATPQPHILSLEDRMRKYAKDRNGKSFYGLLCTRFGEKELKKQELKGGTTGIITDVTILSLISEIDEMLLE
jgi:hypothetical protein